MTNFSAITISHTENCSESRNDFTRQFPEEVLKTLAMEKRIDGYVYLSTCLRCDIFIHHSGTKIPEELLSLCTGYNFQTLRGVNAVHYLFNLVCGMDSLIIGENQILSQIKKSHSTSLEQGHSCGEINVIFNHAISLGKSFQTQSRVNHHGLSLERSIIAYLNQNVIPYKDKKIFLIGIGELSRSILDVLIKEGVSNITVTTRSSHRLQEVETKLPVGKVSFEEKFSKIAESDIIISATSAPHPIVTLNEYRKLTAREGGKTIVDLAIPPDFEPAIGNLKEVTLCTLDDLFAISRKNMEQRKAQAEKFSYLIGNKVTECVEYFEKRREYRWAKIK